MGTQTVSSAPQPTVPAEVVAFAREQGVEQYLSPLIELTRRVYPGATRFEVFTEDDPEIADDRHIVFGLEASLDPSQARNADLRWHRGVFGIVPSPLVCVYRLRLDLGP